MKRAQRERTSEVRLFVRREGDGRDRWYRNVDKRKRARWVGVGGCRVHGDESMASGLRRHLSQSRRAHSVVSMEPCV